MRLVHWRFVITVVNIFKAIIGKSNLDRSLLFMALKIMLRKRLQLESVSVSGADDKEKGGALGFVTQVLTNWIKSSSFFSASFFIIFTFSNF